jgi:hypothetical protein
MEHQLYIHVKICNSEISVADNEYQKNNSSFSANYGTLCTNFSLTIYVVCTYIQTRTPGFGKYW